MFHVPLYLKNGSMMLTLLSGIALAEEAPRSFQAENRYFDSAGTRIHYVDEGEGEPVLLIHGFSSDFRDFGSGGRIGCRLLEALRDDGYRVIAMDIRAHGQSDSPRGMDSYGLEMVEDPRRLLDQIGLKRAHVVGYSLGGAIANKLRELHPERLLSVTLVGVGVPEDGAPPKFAEVIASLEQGDGIFPMLRMFLPDTPEEEVRQASAAIMENRDQKALADLLRSIQELKSDRSTLEENRVPTFAIIGADDPLMPDFRNMATAMTNLEIFVLDGANHITIPASPEFPDRIIDFIRNHQGLD